MPDIGFVELAIVLDKGGQRGFQPTCRPNRKRERFGHLEWMNISNRQTRL